jgi:predicted MFS family arabinose efflux permease
LSSITAAVLGASATTVTGNTVVGGSERSLALGLAAVGAAAITGNVLVGRVLLPENRPFPAPLDTWQPLNTII